jgi:hypothetical protein
MEISPSKGRIIFTFLIELIGIAQILEKSVYLNTISCISCYDIFRKICRLCKWYDSKMFLTFNELPKVGMYYYRITRVHYQSKGKIHM